MDTRSVLPSFTHHARPPARSERSWQWRLLALSLLLPLVAGCGGGGSSPNSSAPGLTRSTTTANGLTLTLSEDTSAITKGQTVNYTFTLTNNSQTAYNSAIFGVCDTRQVIPNVASSIVVTDGAGVSTTVLPLIGAICANTSTGGATLSPGESLHGSLPASTVFSQPGTYIATAVIGVSSAEDNSVPSGPTVTGVTVVVR